MQVLAQNKRDVEELRKKKKPRTNEVLAMGLAPLITSKPNSKIFDLAFSLTFKEMFFSSKIDSNSIKNSNINLTPSIPLNINPSLDIENYIDL